MWIIDNLSRGQLASLLERAESHGAQVPMGPGSREGFVYVRHRSLPALDDLFPKRFSRSELVPVGGTSDLSFVHEGEISLDQLADVAVSIHSARRRSESDRPLVALWVHLASPKDEAGSSSEQSDVQVSLSLRTPRPSVSLSFRGQARETAPPVARARIFNALISAIGAGEELSVEETGEAASLRFVQKGTRAAPISALTPVRNDPHSPPRCHPGTYYYRSNASIYGNPEDLFDVSFELCEGDGQFIRDAIGIVKLLSSKYGSVSKIRFHAYNTAYQYEIVRPAINDESLNDWIVQAHGCWDYTLVDLDRLLDATEAFKINFLQIPILHLDLVRKRQKHPAMMVTVGASRGHPYVWFDPPESVDQSLAFSQDLVKRIAGDLSVRTEH